MEIIMIILLFLVFSIGLLIGESIYRQDAKYFERRLINVRKWWVETQSENIKLNRERKDILEIINSNEAEAIKLKKIRVLVLPSKTN